MKLKILKDLWFLFSDRMKLEHTFLEWAKRTDAQVCPMNVISWVEPFVHARDRKEAIRWIKELQELQVYKEGVGIPNEYGPFFDDEYHSFECVIEFIKYFFSITEEELK